MFGKVSRDKISVTLPSRVNKVIVVQYGGTVLCYAIAYKKKVYAGKELDFQSNNPFVDRTKGIRKIN